MEQPHSHTAGHAFTSFPGQCIGKQKEDKVNNKDLTPLCYHYDHVVRPNLEAAYAEMAKDKKREKEAKEWMMG